MLKEKKIWLKEKGEIGKEWIKEHKFEVGYVTGIVVISAASTAYNKIFGVKKGRIEYVHDMNNNTVRANVIDINRFGKEKTLRSLMWENPDALKGTVDALNVMVYPGD